MNAPFWHMTMLLGGCLFDLCIGDPLWLPHPVRWMGRLGAFLEQRLNRGGKRRAKGAAGVTIVLLASVCLPGAALWLAFQAHPAAAWLLGAFWCGQLLCCRNLYQESMTVYDALAGEDLTRARERLSRIVGRDTGALTEEGVIRAAVETVAENASDGVGAPLLYLALFGPLGGFCYKAVNTLDSMWGYRNERYLKFGCCAARLDDLCGLLPSRLTALAMTAAAGLCGLDAGNAWRMFRRDRMRHASPNSAQTESACAGALHIRLGGPASYFGRPVDKPFLGDADRPPCREDIRLAGRLLFATSFLLAAAMTALLLLAAAAWSSPTSALRDGISALPDRGGSGGSTYSITHDMNRPTAEEADGAPALPSRTLALRGGAPALLGIISSDRDIYSITCDANKPAKEDSSGVPALPHGTLTLPDGAPGQPDVAPGLPGIVPTLPDGASARSGSRAEKGGRSC